MKQKHKIVQIILLFFSIVLVLGLLAGFLAWIIPASYRAGGDTDKEFPIEIIAECFSGVGTIFLSFVAVAVTIFIQKKDKEEKAENDIRQVDSAPTIMNDFVLEEITKNEEDPNEVSLYETKKSFKEKETKIIRINCFSNDQTASQFEMLKFRKILINVRDSEEKEYSFSSLKDPKAVHLTLDENNKKVSYSIFLHISKDSQIQTLKLCNPNSVLFIFDITQKNGVIIRANLQVNFKNGHPFEYLLHNLEIEKSGLVKVMG